MEIRDADEEDATALATLADAPVEVMRNIVHDRTVRVAEYAGEDDSDEARSQRIAGYVSFDAERDTVFVTQLHGERDALERLLEEPVRFARQEAMDVEFLATSADERLQSVARAAGFECTGNGPTFKNEPTKRYRIEHS